MAKTILQKKLLQRVFSMQHELNDLLRKTFGPDPFGVDFDPERWEKWMPLADLYRRGGQWVVRVELPEVEPNGVSLSTVGNRLLIQGERKQPERLKGEEFIFQECLYGPFERVITFPGAIPEDQIQASFEEGVLYITLPAMETQGKKIEIQSGEPPQSISDAA
jgi:HSP20 family protein